MPKLRRQGSRELSPEDLRERIEIMGCELEDFFRELRGRSPVHDQAFAAEHEAAQAMIEGNTDGAGLLAESLQNPVLGLDPTDLFFDIGAVEKIARGGPHA